MQKVIMVFKTSTSARETGREYITEPLAFDLSVTARETNTAVEKCRTLENPSIPTD